MRTKTPVLSAVGARLRDLLTTGLRRANEISHGLVNPDSIRTATMLALARIGGPVLSVVIARTFGADTATDRFFLTFAVATYILETVAAVTETTSVPFLVRARTSGATWSTVRRLALGSAAAAGSLAVMVGVGAGVWWSAAPDPVVLTYATILLGYVIVGAVASALSGALYAARRYALAASSSGLRPLLATAFVLILGPHLGIVVLALGLVAGVACQTVLLWWAGRREYLAGASHGARVRPRAFFREASWQLLGSMILGLVPLADRAFATTLPAGSVTLLEYCTRLWSIPVTLMLSGTLIVVLTNWSELGFVDPGTLRAEVSGASRAMLALTIPVAGLMILFRGGVVEMLLNWGSLTHAQVGSAAAAFAALAAGIPFYLVGLLHARALTAMRRSVWLAVAAAVGLAMKLGLNLWLAPLFGIAGIATATAVTQLATLAVLRTAFQRSFRTLDSRQLVAPVEAS